MAKKICWGIFALIILVMGVRVVYVNATYPNARFKTVDSSEEMKYRDCSIKIDNVTYYSKSQWSKYAKEQGFDFFCTTLSISPLKNSQKINQIGYEVAQKYGIKWLPSDFKKREGYKRSIELSKEYNLYRQSFCGCIFSKENNNE